MLSTTTHENSAAIYSSRETSNILNIFSGGGGGGGIIPNTMEGQSGQKEHFLILIDLLILINDSLILRNIY